MKTKIEPRVDKKYIEKQPPIVYKTGTVRCTSRRGLFAAIQQLNVLPRMDLVWDHQAVWAKPFIVFILFPAKWIQILSLQLQPAPWPVSTAGKGIKNAMVIWGDVIDAEP